MSGNWFVILLSVLQVIAGVVYLCTGHYMKALYWLACVLANLSLLKGY